MSVTGRINSLQSMGAVDGPGLRYVVFMQGCPLRCVFCHNPETWSFAEGTVYSAEEIVRKALRCRPYFGEKGGVTVTGGEPLLQPLFVAGLFRLLHEEGINTALDTSGIGDIAEIHHVLKHTDLVLADVKFLNKEDYRKYCHADFAQVQEFLALTEEYHIPLIIRHVVIPGLTDTHDNIKKLRTLAAQYSNLIKIELLPFRKLCLEKYDALDIPFPLKDTPEMPEDKLAELNKLIQTNTNQSL